jgi:hypothetical protein
MSAITWPELPSGPAAVRACYSNRGLLHVTLLFAVGFDRTKGYADVFPKHGRKRRFSSEALRDVFPGEFDEDGELLATSPLVGLHPTDLGLSLGCAVAWKGLWGPQNQEARQWERPTAGRAVPQWPGLKEVFNHLKEGNSALVWQDIGLNTDAFDNSWPTIIWARCRRSPTAPSGRSSENRSGRPPTRSLPQRRRSPSRETFATSLTKLWRPLKRPSPPKTPSPLLFGPDRQEGHSPHTGVRHRWPLRRRKVAGVLTMA